MSDKKINMKIELIGDTLGKTKIKLFQNILMTEVKTDCIIVYFAGKDAQIIPMSSVISASVF